MRAVPSQPAPGATKDSASVQHGGYAPEIAGGSAQRALSSEAAGGGTATPRLMTRDVTLRLRVKDVAATAKQVSLMAGAAGGWVESMQLATDKGATVTLPQPVATDSGSGTAQSTSPDAGPLGGYVSVRVPAAKLDRFRKDVSAMGSVVFESTDAADVTAQHIDMKARLDNLKATEESLRRLMDRAGSITEVLAVQNQLTSVQGQIESLTAQLASLDEQVAMASVTVQLAGPEQVVSPAGDDWGFLTALRDSLRAFVGTTNVMIVLFGGLLPVVILFGLAGLLIWWLVRVVSRRRRVAAVQPAVVVSDEAAVAAPGDAALGEEHEDTP